METVDSTKVNDKEVNSKQQYVNDADKATAAIKISDLRSTLNGQIYETNKQLIEISLERDQVKGAPLTNEQVEKLAASTYLNGADKQLDKQTQELQAKWDKLSQDEKDSKAFAKEHRLDTTLWRHAPGFMKEEGLKGYESSVAAIEDTKQILDKQAAEIQAKRDQLQAQLQTPEAKSEIGKKSREIMVQNKERLAKLGALDKKQNQLTNEKHEILALKNIIQSRKLDDGIKLQGDVKDVKNLLGQTDHIKQQVADMQPTQ